MRHSRIRIGVLVCFCLTLSACGKKSSSPVGPRPSIQVNIVNGQNAQLSAAELFVTGPVVWTSDDEFIVTVDRNTGLATAIKIGVARITATSPTGTGSALIGVVSPNLGKSFSLSGKAEYEDKPFDQNGFTGELLPTPIRNAVIKVIAIDGFSELASGVTDNVGNYLGLPPLIGDSTRRGGVYVQVLAKTNPVLTNSGLIEIQNNLTDQALLSVISSAFDNNSEGATFPKDVLAPADSIGGAFNVLDIFSKANEFLCPSTLAPSNCPLPLLTGYWEPGGSAGTHFTVLSNQQSAVFICGGGEGKNCVLNDSDVYDDAVIAHEYGHFALTRFSHDDSPGGSHDLSDNGQDIRLSWSEGWANFFSSATRTSPIYVDTWSMGSFFFNLENYSPGLNLSAVYTTSEIAVAGVLWDILDPANEGHDNLGMGFNPILDTIRQMPLADPATMESFWLAFEALHFSSSADLQAILIERKIELFPDQGDKTGEEDLIAGGTTQHHTFYLSEMNPFGDVDKIFFDVIKDEVYTLETLKLTNGADTFLTIMDSMGNTLFKNNNWNGVTHLGCGVNQSTGISTCPLNGRSLLFPTLPEPLSSLITWTATATEQLSVEVKRAPLAPPSAGQFGSYELKLTVTPTVP